MNGLKEDQLPTEASASGDPLTNEHIGYNKIKLKMDSKIRIILIQIKQHLQLPRFCLFPLQSMISTGVSHASNAHLPLALDFEFLFNSPPSRGTDVIQVTDRKHSAASRHFTL